MERKSYQAPKVVKVPLEFKHSILSVCNSSPASYLPKQEPLNNCKLEQNCFNIAGY